MTDEPQAHPEPPWDEPRMDVPSRDADEAVPEGPGMAVVDELLDALAAEPEPLPPGLIDEVERFMVGRRQHRRWALAAAAAAVAGLVATCWLATQFARRAPQGAAPPPVASAFTERPREEPGLAAASGPWDVGRLLGGRAGGSVSRGGVTVEPGPGLLAVPVRTDDPKVTIFWLYETVGAPEGESQ